MPDARLADAERLARLLDAVLLVGSDLSLPAVLERLVEAACSLVHARYGALGVLDEARTGLAEFITFGADEETVRRIGDLPRGHGILGLLIVDPRPLRLGEIRSHPDSYGFPPNHPPMSTFLGVPIRARGEVFGNLYLTERVGGGEFTQEDEDLVVALASAAGIAIDNARLHARAREVDLLTDRERIARDLHDLVIQRLFATGLVLQGAARLAVRPEVKERIQEAVDDLDITIRQIRSTIFALESVGGGSLRSAVLEVVAELRDSIGVAPEVVFSGPVDSAVDPSLAEHLLAALREALANVARHADATRVVVAVSAGDELVLRVVDNGVGVGAARRSGGRGLGNLRRRAESLGGTSVVEGSPGGGTVLEWRVPARTRPA